MTLLVGRFGKRVTGFPGRIDWGLERRRGLPGYPAFETLPATKLVEAGVPLIKDVGSIPTASISVRRSFLLIVMRFALSIALWREKWRKL